MGVAPVDCVWKLGLQLGAALGVGPTQLKEVGPWGWTLKFLALPLCSLLPNVTICRKLLPLCLSQYNGLCALKLCPRPSSLKSLLARHLITVLESSHIGSQV